MSDKAKAPVVTKKPPAKVVGQKDVATKEVTAKKVDPKAPVWTKGVPPKAPVTKGKPEVPTKQDTKVTSTSSPPVDKKLTAVATKTPATKSTPGATTKAPAKPDVKGSDQVKQLINDLKAGPKDAEAIEKLPSVLEQLYQMALKGKQQEVSKAVPAVITILEDPKLAKNAAIQSKGCAIFWALAFDSPAQGKDLGKKVIPLILKILKNFSSDATVQQQGYGALGNLAVNNEANKQLMVSGAPTIWKTVVLLGTKGGATVTAGKDADRKPAGKAPDPATSAVVSGLALLKMLANYNDGGDREDDKAKTGGYKPKLIVPVAEAGELVRIMEKHAANAAIQLYACGLIQNIGFKPAYAAKLVGAKKAILLTMTKQGSSSSIGALANLTSAIYDAKGGDKKDFDDCVGPVVKTMQAHKADAGVQEQGCAALLSLTYLHPVNQNAVAKAKGIDVIVAAMKTHKNSDKCQRNACGALLNLSTDNAKNKKEIVSSGGIASIITAMKAHADNVNVQLEGCSVLYNLSQSLDRLLVEKAGAKAVIDAALKAHKKNGALVFKANAALDALAGTGGGTTDSDPKSSSKVITDKSAKAVATGTKVIKLGDKAGTKATTASTKAIKAGDKAVTKATATGTKAVEVGDKAVTKATTTGTKVAKAGDKAVVKATTTGTKTVKAGDKAVVKATTTAGTKAVKTGDKVVTKATTTGTKAVTKAGDKAVTGTKKAFKYEVKIPKPVKI